MSLWFLFGWLHPAFWKRPWTGPVLEQRSVKVQAACPPAKAKSNVKRFVVFLGTEHIECQCWHSLQITFFLKSVYYSIPACAAKPVALSIDFSPDRSPSCSERMSRDTKIVQVLFYVETKAPAVYAPAHTQWQCNVFCGFFERRQWMPMLAQLAHCLCLFRCVTNSPACAAQCVALSEDFSADSLPSCPESIWLINTKIVSGLLLRRTAIVPAVLKSECLAVLYWCFFGSPLN